MHTVKTLAAGLALLLGLTACAAPAATAPTPSPTPEPTEAPTTEPVRLPELTFLRELVDWQADEYLSTVYTSREEALEALSLRTYCAGLQLEDGTEASMALFTVLNPPTLPDFSAPSPCCWMRRRRSLWASLSWPPTAWSSNS